MYRSLYVLTSLFLCSLFPPAALPQVVTPVVIASNLESPLAIEAAGDGTGDLYIVEQAGRILRYRDGAVQPQTFLDITAQVSCCMERGLLGLAFHPDFASNGEFFVNYTNDSFDTVIAGYTANNGSVDADSEEILLTIEQPFANHNGGQLAFGPDGFLYIGMGDGGSAGDPQDNAQDPLTLLGKMLRIDVDNGNPFTIPDDNPFAFTDATLDEIWALGLRNPYRFSFDAITGDLYIADVGQDLIEEVHVHRANTAGGENFGWRLMEGSQCFNPATECNDGSLTLPAFEYTHAQNRCSITGGYVYRGSAIPALAGSYIFGDFCTGEIFRADFSDNIWTQEVIFESGFSISSFGQDEAGELYVVDLDGSVYKLIQPFNISPGNGKYLSSQVVDLAFILRKPGVSVTDLQVELNGLNISSGVENCLVEGELAVGGLTFRCANIPLRLLPEGIYKITANAVLSDGNSVSDTVIWEILNNSEN